MVLAHGIAFSVSGFFFLCVICFNLFYCFALLHCAVFINPFLHSFRSVYHPKFNVENFRL